MVQRVLAGVGLLAEQPGLGRPGRVPGTRELLVPKTRYIAPYRVRGDTAKILRVFHTSRQPPRQGWRHGDDLAASPDTPATRWGRVTSTTRVWTPCNRPLTLASCSGLTP